MEKFVDFACEGGVGKIGEEADFSTWRPTGKTLCPFIARSTGFKVVLIGCVGVIPGDEAIGSVVVLCDELMDGGHIVGCYTLIGV